MEPHESEQRPKRRLQKKSGKTILLFIFLLVTLVIILIYFIFPDTIATLRQASLPAPVATSSVSESSPDPSIEARAQDVEEIAPKDDTIEQEGAAKSETEAEADTDGSTTDLPAGSTPEIAGEADVPEQSSGTVQTAVTATPASSVCTERADNVEAFFDTLDTRPYMQNFKIGQKSSIYFPALIQKLVDNPPVVSGETDDLFTILQNTAHFFRIIGKKNILILKGILDREKPTFEKTLADFYELTKYPECMEERFDLRIGNDPLYYYAGFFVNTMGGRLYLFRRDSMSRMVVSYYAILIIEQANREGRNTYGLDISSSIDNLINEIESSSIELQMREMYLDTLYDLKEKYQ